MARQLSESFDHQQSSHWLRAATDSHNVSRAAVIREIIAQTDPLLYLCNNTEKLFKETFGLGSLCRHMGQKVTDPIAVTN